MLLIVGLVVAGVLLFEHAIAPASETAASQSPRILERGYHFRGTAARFICSNSFHVGDTVSITLSETGGFDLSVPAWVSTLRGRIRRIRPASTGPKSVGMQFILERLEGRGSAHTGMLAEITTDVESVRHPSNRDDEDCVGGGADRALFGTFLRTLRVR